MLKDAILLGLRSGGAVAVAVFTIMVGINTIFYAYVSHKQFEIDVYLAAVVYPAARAALALSVFGFASVSLLMFLILWSATRRPPGA